MAQSLDEAVAPAPPRDKSRERDLLAVIAGLVCELHPQRSRFIEISLSSRLERDLGIDSLARTELMLRVERAFRVRLPIAVIGGAETIGDVLQAFADIPSDRSPER